MSAWRLILRSFWHHWRTDGAVALGVTAAAAVLTGALIVGDSVRGSLRYLILDRLGSVDSALVTDRFFRGELAEQLAKTKQFGVTFERAVPVILLEATLEDPASGRRANRTTVIGSGGDFYRLGHGGPARPPEAGEIVLNAPLAEHLGVKLGDEVILRMPLANEIPPDSPLGRKTETISSRRLKLTETIPAAGLGRFGLRPNQQIPFDAFVATETIQSALDQAGRVNAILVSGRDPRYAPPDAAQRLDRLLAPQLTDYGLSLVKSPRGYFNLTSQRMLLDPAVERAVIKAYPKGQPALTYLANTIAAGGREIPYSTVAALDPVAEPPLGPLVTTAGEPLVKIGDGEVVLNTWAAEELNVQPGDNVRLTFFKPESTHGQTEEETVELRLAAIVRLEGAAADPGFTPEVKGITDEASIADWDPPFPFDAKRVRSVDEAYWDEHRGTPKAFVSLATGERLWGSRFGQATSIRIPPPHDTATAEELARQIKIDPADLGFVFRPVKQQGLVAATGTTPFNMLFLGFSLFIIVAALMLVGLLFRLAIEVRARELGVLAAVGIPARRIRRIWATEGLLMATVGAVAGVLLGVAYAWLMLTGLNTWWVDAVTSPFVQLYVTGTSLVAGYTIAVAMSWLTIWWTLWRLRGIDIRRLLAGETTKPATTVTRANRRSNVFAALALAAAVVLTIPASRLSGEAQAGAFMGSGALVLTGLLFWLRSRLRLGQLGGALASQGAADLSRMAARNTARHPTRSMLTIGLVAAAVFLIVAISAFRLAPPDDSGKRATGTGGFALVAESDQPIYENLNEHENLGLQAGAGDVLADTTIYEIRVRAGDDASCLNLYQSQQPRVLGVPRAMIRRGGFQWAATLAESDAERANPWLLLDRDWGKSDGGEPLLPVVLDAATAMYSLHLAGAGARYDLPAGAGRPAIPCVVVGLLKNSVLQGDLITSEPNFLRSFPTASGYRLFLVDAPADRADAVATALERGLGDYGFDAQRASDRLARYLVVQNTYLSTFQSLGGLGLLLGTLGLAVVELRNVLERRGELALLRAVGFRQRLLTMLVMGENLVLLALGLTIGLVAALVAVLPHLVAGDATVPWRSLAGMLALVLVAGFLAGLTAVRAVLRAPLIAALRGD